MDKAFSSFMYVDDDIVIDLVSRAIDDAEQEKNSWIVEGFPRTLAQVMVLQKLRIMPDKMIHLAIEKR